MYIYNKYNILFFLLSKGIFTRITSSKKKKSKYTMKYHEQGTYVIYKKPSSSLCSS
jgi:hypothetical protein